MQKVPPPKVLVIVLMVSTEERGAAERPGRGATEDLIVKLQLTLPQLEEKTAWKSSQRLYVGEGLPPIALRLAGKIQKGELIEMEEMVPELWPSTHQEGEAKPQIKKNQRVTDTVGCKKS